MKNNSKENIINMEKSFKRKDVTQLSFEDLFSETNVLDNISTNVTSAEKSENQLNNCKMEIFPANLVRDFDLFVDYIQIQSVQLTKTMEYITRKHLSAINDRMSVRNEAATNYTEQENYPYIHLFYYLALSGRLFEKLPAKAGKLELVVTKRAKLYMELSDVEKYFFLLETLWVDVNWARLLNERNNLLSMSLQDLFYLLSQEKPGYTLSLRENKAAALGLSYRLDKWKYFSLYFEWFGLWEYEADQELMNAYGTKGVYFAKSIRLTTFGAKIIPILLVLRNLDIWNIALRRESGELNPIPGSKLEDMMFGDIPQEFVDAIFDIMEEDQSSQPFFLPFVQLFPKETLRNSLPRSKKKFNDGIFTFKISLSNKIWRQVVLSGKHTMDELHQIILNAFGFDDDHLYSFFMDGRKWSDDCITSPYDDFGHLNANKVQIGEIGLELKQRFLYLYDYGDEWTFTVEVDQLEELDSKLFNPYVKASAGEAPIQYGYEEF